MGIAKGEGKIGLLMKNHHSGRYEHYLAAIAAGATTATQNRNATVNCAAPRDRNAMPL